ncbi:outer membrane protein assembly factor BamB family protein [Botrimarina hoheduenensis]|uniref:Outer membrane biogenesis protein BamB n=1 Tax=Botrimarina hoheduenensis TaxID=2528000 RepID=A0A5C5VYU6_9BACT|nr:PQQ-binding-like beta-propeller repeat protein [Botrimarina hoheduenensis]TWT43133.1 outer membrane biogenesis protein BamB [Botrimarina hoheduenensis]
MGPRFRVLQLVMILSAATTAGADWPQFRGAQANGVATGAAPPTDWSPASNLAWSVAVPGEGWSMPIIVGEKVLVTSAVPVAPDSGTGTDTARYRFEVRCYDLSTGELRWSRVAAEQAPRAPRHATNTYASETPVTDGEFVYASFGPNGLYCYGLDGELRWSKDLGVYPMANDWGSASSLALHQGLLFVQNDNEQQSHLVALDKATGEQRWRVERPGEVSNWSTPIVWRNSVRTELVVGGKTVRSYDPATGVENWSMSIGGRSSASPATDGDTLIVGSENRVRRGGSPGGLFAVRAGAQGAIEVSQPEAAGAGLVWANPRGAVGMASPLVVDGKIYILPRRGAILRVHDLATGEQIHQGRLQGGSTFWASPWAAGGKIYLLDDAGTTFVFSPPRGYEPIAANALPGQFWSTPAVSDGAIVLRSADRLYCVRAQDADRN